MIVQSKLLIGLLFAELFTESHASSKPRDLPNGRALIG